MVDYIDLTYFSNYTRTVFDSNSDPSDTIVQQYIDDANQEVEDLTGRVWNRVDGHVEYIESPNQLQLLSKRPVLNIQSVVDNDGNPVPYTSVDRDFIKLSKTYPITVTYDYGYDSVPIAVKKLATLYTLRSMTQGGSASSDNTESISVGPISISSRIGLSTIVNLESDIKTYENRIRRLIR